MKAADTIWVFREKGQLISYKFSSKFRIVSISFWQEYVIVYMEKYADIMDTCLFPVLYHVLKWMAFQRLTKMALHVSLN